MKVFIACEYSGTVRRAFRNKGHDAWSCDLLASEDNSFHHIQGDATKFLDRGWDMLIAHPPCTRLCNSGVRWLHKAPPGRTLEEMHLELIEGAALFSKFLNCSIPKICIENPVMHKYAKSRISFYREFSQSVQPWEFGHGEIKRTCFWLRGLPNLVPRNIVGGRLNRVHAASPGKERWKERSRFFSGIAEAMADQWGILSP